MQRSMQYHYCCSFVYLKHTAHQGIELIEPQNMLKVKDNHKLSDDTIQ